MYDFYTSSRCLQLSLFLISPLIINASVSSTAHRIPIVPGCLAAGVAEATVEVGLHFLINGLLLPPPPLRGNSCLPSLSPDTAALPPPAPAGVIDLRMPSP